jgi:hypothetical protein
MLKYLIAIFVTFGCFASNIGQNITKCANNFLGTPYDTNPIGEYVAKQTIVYDKAVDCMYFVFRCTELAMANFDDTKSQEVALKMRFKTQGIVDGGKVVNYDDRFEYAEDMVLSAKWGRNVTKSIGRLSAIEGSRGVEQLSYVKNNDINYKKLQNGDIVFFVKDPSKRVVGEIIGHLGFIEVENGIVYFIHASGVKRKTENSGMVKKVVFKDYIENTKFIGIAVKRI